MFFVSFAAIEIQEYNKQMKKKDNNTQDRDHDVFGQSPESLLFRMAAQDSELTYFRSLDIIERYQNPD